ncbi:MAG TPA: Rid family detoxifying hydrolase [Acidimicrobiia bacterium]|nr:Rid family detoxifying hydrolase [Acidimicrobiia bacterium]
MSKRVPDLPNAPRPLAPYSVAIESEGLIFISGQVALPGDGSATPDDVALQTRVIMENLGAILADLGLSYQDLVKTTIFLTNMADFASVNEVYGSYFAADPPARSTIQVAALPRPEFRIEIEAIASR